VKAARRYRLIITRSGRGPALLANPARVDHVEIVDVDSGEVVLFWDLAVRDASRLARAIREDLNRMADDEFLEKWSAA